MKKIMTVVLASAVFCGPAFADESQRYHSDLADRAVQLGADLVVPYQVSEPRGRTATLLGVHGEILPVPELGLGVEGIFGVEDRGFSDKPVYLAPGLSFYPSPGKRLEPYLRADVPLLLNNGKDVGIRGGLGFMWNFGLLGLGLKYSFDAAYFFDSKETVLDLAHVAAVFNW